MIRRIFSIRKAIAIQERYFSVTCQDLDVIVLDATSASWTCLRLAIFAACRRSMSSASVIRFAPCFVLVIAGRASTRVRGDPAVPTSTGRYRSVKPGDDGKNKGAPLTMRIAGCRGKRLTAD